MSISFHGIKLRDFNYSRRLEWLETNGLGGYASSTVSGAHSRKYHGLLVAATVPPVERMVVVSKLDESLIDGSDRYELSANQYPGVIYPAGFQHLQSFVKDLFPQFTYRAGKIEIKKTIAAVQGENTTLVLFEVLDARQPFVMQLLPLYACRDIHNLAHANPNIATPYLFDNGVFRTMNYQGCPEFFISVPGADFIERTEWFYNFEYSAEQERGMDFKEDLFTHGKFSVTLKKGDKLAVIISTIDPGNRDPWALYHEEKLRREQLANRLSWNDELRTLAIAADQFVVRRGDLKTIIAGYHWFTDWGRDTMIALPGLCLATGRYEEAKNILQTFTHFVDKGMLPNRFPDHGEKPEYNTIDATLWFFLAIYKYYQHTHDKSFVKLLMPTLSNIMEWHDKGTRYNIHVDKSDGLLSGGQEGVQLTWMDAKVGDWVVTPRRGKVVEINALWYNALCAMAHLREETGQLKEASTYHVRAEKVRENFERKFWNAQQQCLYDYIDGDNKNDDMRPNQIFAISLPFPLLSGRKAEKVFNAVESVLITPRGLRSLSPEHKDYKPVYAGGIRERDGAYHQGTVWSYLIGPYVDALLYIKENKGKAAAARILSQFFDHLHEAGVGTVSEIFDGESPHSARGCIAQAWGVAEVLRVAIEHDLFLSPKTAYTRGNNAER